MKDKLINKIFPLIIRIFDPIMKKSSGIWIVSGNNLRGINGNSLHLLNYLIEKNTKDKIYCLSIRKEIIHSLNKKVKYLDPRTLKGLWILLRSAVIFISHGIKDLYWRGIANSPKRLIFNLWHGAMLKNVGLDSLDLSVEEKKMYVKNEFEKYDYFIVSSQPEQVAASKCFKIPADRIVITGLPKNDVLFKPDCKLDLVNPKLKNALENSKKVVLYAPTFRDYEGREGFLQCLLDFSVEKLEEVLKKYNAIFIIRNHINDKCFPEFPDSDYVYYAGFDVVNDAQELLKKADILVTDYSGIIFDFLLLDRPMISIKADIDRYTRERGFVYNFDSVFPGAKVNTFREFTKWLDVYLTNSSTHQELRQSLRRRFHEYQDGKACERIVNVVKKRLNHVTRIK